MQLVLGQLISGSETLPYDMTHAWKIMQEASGKPSLCSNGTSIMAHLACTTPSVVHHSNGDDVSYLEKDVSIEKMSKHKCLI